MTWKLVQALVAAVVCALVVSNEAAGAEITIPQEYGKTIKSAEVVGALGNDLFGEQVNLYTGSTSFAVTDVSLPGNDALPVRIGRRYVVEDRDDDKRPGLFADWELDIPWLSGVFAKNAGWQVYDQSRPNARCSVAVPPPDASGDQGGTFAAEEFWTGHTLHMPGQGDMEMLADILTNPDRPTDGAQYPWTTSERWFFSCLPTIGNGAGEGFLALAPDGTRYWFDWMVKRRVKTLKKSGAGPVGFAASGAYILSREEVRILPTKVQDRFGNTVTYTYDPNNPWRLLSITSSEIPARSLTLTYNAAGRIATVSDGTRTWTYTYGTNGDLSEVRLPDASKWSYNLTAVGDAMVAATLDAKCVLRPSRETQSSYTGTITHPSGAVGTFVFKPTLHGRSYVQQTCVGGTGDGSYARHAWLFDSIALQTKTITGMGIATPAQWTYTYGTPNNSWLADCPGDSCVGTKTVEVSGQGEWARHTFSNRWRKSEGKLIKVEQGTGPTNIIKTDATDYLLDATYQQYPAQWGVNPFARGDSAAQQVTPVWRRVVTQQGATFTWQVDVKGGSTLAFDSYARPLSTTRTGTIGSLTHTRKDELTYKDYPSLWVIGLPATSTTNGLVEYALDYNAMALPEASSVFGKPKYKATYNANGTLATISDGRDSPSYDTTISYSGWMRGTPQLITYPDAATESAVVNTLGQIKSVTDETGAKTCYEYDPMGRLSKITHPSEADPATCSTANWLATTITFNNVTGAAYGLPAGQWRQTTSTGNNRRVVLFDALWRPVVDQTLDLGNVANSTKEIFRRYDDDGRVLFESYPMDSKGLAVFTDTTIKGTTTTYDALGRPTLVTQDSELGALLTKTEYLPNFTTRLTNPRLHQTTTSYYAWDTPTQDYPNVIAHPEGATTSIERDAFGKTLSLLRTGTDGSWQRRYFRYNAQQELCNRTELESVTTALGYDAAGNLAWSAGGLPWQPNGCPDANDPNVLARRTIRTYDQRNRVTALAFPDGRGDTSYAYTPDGQLQTLTVANASGNGDQVTTSYAYNKRRLLSAETLQASGKMWSLVYQYTAHGNLASHIYPNGFTVAYAPDPLGRATTVGSYASSVLYHPNNAVESFTFGNGETHQMWQNVRGMPDRSRDAAGSVAIVDDSYDYDANGNVAAITDALTGNVGNRDMTYDGLDRLKTVVAPKMFGGGATYSYDALDNMTRVAIGGPRARDHHYCYDTNKRLTNVKTGSCSGSSVIGMGYDVQGNLANQNGVLYAFDYGNRLRTVTQTSGLTSTYAYDGHGRRVRATDSGVDIFSMYAMDGTLVFQEDLKRNKRIYHASLAGDPVAQIEQDIATGVVETRYTHTDALGSPVAVTGSAGSILERTQYEPYGAVINRPPRDGVGYTGHVEDSATSLVQMQQRSMWAGGRFISVDPVLPDMATGANFNRYWYADNNPYRYRDPDGRRKCPGSSRGECIESDTYDSSRSNGQTTRASESVGRAMVSQKDVAAVRGGSKEKIAFVKSDGAGGHKVELASDATTSRTSRADSATAAIPMGAEAVLHGHIDGRTDGLISPGDAGSLRSGLPNGVVSLGRVGVTEIVNGRLQFRMLEGKMTPHEVRELQKSLDNQQRQFMSPEESQ